MSNASRPKNFLLLLSIVNLVNFIDRQLIFALFPLIKSEFSASDFHLGLLGTTFMITHAIATVPLGILADRYPKRKLMITLGMVFWCSFTFVSGLAKRLLHLIVARAFIGLGGATFEPAAVSLITERVDQSYRGRALGLLRAGMWVGGTLGLILGGVLGTTIGWRNTFFIAALPGFVLAFFTWNLHEKPLIRHGDVERRKIFDWNPLVILIILAGTFANFTAGGFITWIITFIDRYGYFDLRTASVVVGVPAAISGLLGVFAGSHIADRLYQKMRGGRILTGGLGMLLSTPFVILGLHAPTSSPSVLVVSVALGTFFMAWYHGSIMAALMDSVAPSARGAMVGMYVFFIHIFGDMPAPAVVGWISDLFNLRIAMTVLVLGNVLCALCFFIAMKVGYQKREK